VNVIDRGIDGKVNKEKEKEKEKEAEKENQKEKEKEKEQEQEQEKEKEKEKEQEKEEIRDDQKSNTSQPSPPPSSSPTPSTNPPQRQPPQSLTRNLILTKTNKRWAFCRYLLHTYRPSTFALLLQSVSSPLRTLILEILCNFSFHLKSFLNQKKFRSFYLNQTKSGNNGSSQDRTPSRPNALNLSLNFGLKNTFSILFGFFWSFESHFLTSFTSSLSSLTPHTSLSSLSTSFSSSFTPRESVLVVECLSHFVLFRSHARLLKIFISMQIHNISLSDDAILMLFRLLCTDTVSLMSNFVLPTNDNTNDNTNTNTSINTNTNTTNYVSNDNNTISTNNNTNNNINNNTNNNINNNINNNTNTISDFHRLRSLFSDINSMRNLFDSEQLSQLQSQSQSQSQSQAQAQTITSFFSSPHLLTTPLPFLPFPTSDENEEWSLFLNDDGMYSRTVFLLLDCYCDLIKNTTASSKVVQIIRTHFLSFFFCLLLHPYRPLNLAIHNLFGVFFSCSSQYELTSPPPLLTPHSIYPLSLVPFYLTTTFWAFPRATRGSAIELSGRQMLTSLQIPFRRSFAEYCIHIIGQKVCSLWQGNVLVNDTAFYLSDTKEGLELLSCFFGMMHWIDHSLLSVILDIYVSFLRNINENNSDELFLEIIEKLKVSVRASHDYSRHSLIYNWYMDVLGMFSLNELDVSHRIKKGIAKL
jgi:hypothetical protein